jgi:hypothetical protein
VNGRGPAKTKKRIIAIGSLEPFTVSGIGYPNRQSSGLFGLLPQNAITRPGRFQLPVRPMISHQGS